MEIGCAIKERTLKNPMVSKILILINDLNSLVTAWNMNQFYFVFSHCRRCASTHRGRYTPTHRDKEIKAER